MFRQNWFDTYRWARSLKQRVVTQLRMTLLARRNRRARQQQKQKRSHSSLLTNTTWTKSGHRPSISRAKRRAPSLTPLGLVILARKCCQKTFSVKNRFEWEILACFQPSKSKTKCNSTTLSENVCKLTRQEHFGRNYILMINRYHLPKCQKNIPFLFLSWEMVAKLSFKVQYFIHFDCCSFWSEILSWKRSIWS